MLGRALAILSAALAATTGPARATVDEAAFERAYFRTVTVLYPTAPRATVAAATQCMVSASKNLPDSVKQAVIEIDRRPVYRGSDRMNALADALVKVDAATVQPLATCFDRMSDDAFGETRGSTPATAAPNPDNVAHCPVVTSTASGDALTCYCQPMLGGIAYGHKTYSDDSSLCLASRHAGATDYLTGGVVRAVFEPGCASYEGVEANGSLSAAAGRSARSFHFPIVGKGTCPR